MDENQERYEIDLLQMVKDLFKRWYVIAISAILCGLISLSFTLYFITPKYTANIMMYVNNSASSSSSSGAWLSYSDITTARNLVETYTVILTSRSTLDKVIEEASLNCNSGDLKSMLSVQILNETEVFSVSVTHTDPYVAARIANTIAKVLPEEISNIIKSSNVVVVDEASIPTTHSSPNYKINVAFGILIGVVLGAAAVLVYEFFNDEIKSEEWIEKNFGKEIPLLAIIPDLNDKSTYSYNKYRKYGYYTSNKSTLKEGK
ncbi:MAG: hypothetical protein J6K88_02640 [Oscillospiraceae bacterium]|nr:hypothetical protein [Oscillospiraceae bacterium]